MTTTNCKPLIVTTSHRGVFFGYGEVNAGPTIRIANARMVVYWSADCRSVVGLAANGPTAGCKIGPAAPAITLRDVTAVFEVATEAAKKFEAAPWSS
mgnify:CR=1 FL=1